jgi:adenylate cyclase
VLDVGGNLVFVELFTSVLVLVLTQNLDQERRKSDLLLLNILPATIADELKRDERVRPRRYESATVLFTDCVGFTRLAEGMTPEALIAELDDAFSTFDTIARARGLEKIKTIGDAYMAVGGIPVPNRTHPVDCVLAALEIRDAVAASRREREAAGRTAFSIRIGLHTGPLVAGVIGRSKFAYDVWGDTVNTASRMESSGAEGRVNVSRETYDAVAAYFECEPRGRVYAKNKGEIEMFFVNRIRPELSEEGDGARPNARFRAMRDALGAADGAQSAAAGA